MKKEYVRVEKLGYKLAWLDFLIDWDIFRSIIKEMYDNRTELSGRPNNDEMVMMKMLVLKTLVV